MEPFRNYIRLLKIHFKLFECLDEPAQLGTQWNLLTNLIWHNPDSKQFKASNISFWMIAKVKFQSKILAKLCLILG